MAMQLYPRDERAFELMADVAAARTQIAGARRWYEQALERRESPRLRSKLEDLRS